MDFSKIKSEELRELLVSFLQSQSQGSFKTQTVPSSQYQRLGKSIAALLWIVLHIDQTQLFYRPQDCVSFATIILVPNSAMWQKFWDIKQFFPQQVVFADDNGSDE